MNGLGTLKRVLQMKMLSLCSLIMCDRRRSLSDLARKIGISFGAVQPTLTDILRMSKVSAGFVPRILTNDQKKSRLNISKFFVLRFYGLVNQMGPC